MFVVNNHAEYNTFVIIIITLHFAHYEQFICLNVALKCHCVKITCFIFKILKET